MKIRFIIVGSALLFSFSGFTQEDSTAIALKNTFKVSVGDVLSGNAALFYERRLSKGNSFEISLGYQYHILFNSNHDNFSTLQLKNSKGITSSLGYTFMSNKHPMHGLQLRLDYKYIQLDSIDKNYEWTQGDGTEFEGNPSLFFPIEYEIGNGRYSIVKMTERRHVIKQQFFWVIRNKPHNKFFIEFYTGPSIRFAAFLYDIHTIWPGLNKIEGEFNFSDYKVGLWHLYPMYHLGFRIGLRT
ncbi:hypothetical protein N9545_02195 [Salibacteraceae bacterium]|jgi:hypothetical protein|nr:hypothetical protein [Salibacteraceae bacterium]MDB4104318.1 hypothetical protein [Salibacteraceae bacterium]MDB9709458.1 hypothetical protein [Salibacteraceae bacterium]MDC1303979.1 hypothetical protein [Salibacteraceae bacterium]HAQ71242.1 hypothetical protein [Flavobacteriales bacterium]